MMLCANRGLGNDVIIQRLTKLTRRQSRLGSFFGRAREMKKRRFFLMGQNATKALWSCGKRERRERDSLNGFFLSKLQVNDCQTTFFCLTHKFEARPLDP